MNTSKTLMAAAVIAATLAAFSGIAYAQVATPRFDQRQENQDKRIDNGVANGTLTHKEAARMDKQQDRIENMEDRAKADGNVTKREHARLTHAQNKSSRSIYRQKHDRQRAGRR
jgi:uncharacterized membrane protein YebE (DUF533 family)